MLDINLIREKTKWVEEQLLKKVDKVDLDALLKTDKDRRALQTENDELKAQRNAASKDIAVAKKQGKEPHRLIDEMQKLGKQITLNDRKIAELEKNYFALLSSLPNLPDESVPVGGKEANEIVFTFGKKPEFDFTPKNHVDLCTDLGIIDYKRAAKISGAGTWIYTGIGAQLEWALLNYFVDFHTKNNYTFILPPHILNYQSGFSAGQFPKFEEDVFWTDHNTKDRKANKFLLPTSETALINLYRDEILEEKDLPQKLFCYTPCFRREMGSYGSEERGMIRGYQFNKIEMFVFCTPEDDNKFFEELTKNAQALVEGLGLHYQLSRLASKDCTASMAKTFDIEVYIPSMGIYKEVSSSSTAKCFQARRANIRYRDKDCKLHFVHSLNASGLATSRIVPAIVEQFQNKDGSVNVPQILQKYLGGVKIIK